MKFIKNNHIKPELSFIVFVVGIILCVTGIITISVTSSAEYLQDEITSDTVVASETSKTTEIFAISTDTGESFVTDSTSENTRETTFEEETTSKEPEMQYVSLGEFNLTAYCPCASCCGEWGANRPVDKNGNPIVYTASGKIAQAGYTIAADTSIYPFGTILYINGQRYEVQDVGGGIKGNRIDVYFDNHQDALNFGVQCAEVFIEIIG